MGMDQERALAVRAGAQRYTGLGNVQGVFYCGTLHNIPQLTNVITRLIDAESWLDAARCLLASRDAPGAACLAAVAGGLAAKTDCKPGHDAALLALSSLAHRGEPPFEVFRASIPAFQLIPDEPR
jgi:hypothetical protein